MSNKLFTCYRISDGSYQKKRFGTKEECFRNFLRVFKPTINDFNIIADNCNPATLEMLRKSVIHEFNYDILDPSTTNVIQTSFGNGASSWRESAQRMMQSDGVEIVYFLEDDYLHREGSKEAILDGIKYSDYISLYDHNDKYIDGVAGGNPEVEYGGEVTRVIRTKTSHWKLTNSTTMTFATTVKTLYEDWSIWDKNTNRTHPNDFAAFLELRDKGRTLLTPIPGFSTHCEFKWASPGIEWTDYYDSNER